MKKHVYLIFLVIVAFAFNGMGFAEDGKLSIQAKDADNQAVEGVLFGIEGFSSANQPTDSGGVTNLVLPRATRANDWVHLQVLKGTQGNEDWILISPWDGRVAVPSFDNKADNFVLIVVAKKFDRRLLANAKALAAMTASVLNELAPKTAGDTITDEQRQSALADVAKGYGLSADEIDKAIRAWGAKSKDPYEIGLAALYERNYPVASDQLKKSLEMREAELEKKRAEVANSAFFLGNSLYEQGKYQEAANAYRKAAAQRPDDTTIMNNLALSLSNAGNFTEAEPLYKRALATNEEALGPNHPGVATNLNNLAGLYKNQGKYAEAEPLYKRALAIREKVLGPSHPSVATSLNNLAALYTSQGKYAEAEPLYKRALAIREKALGPEHPDLAAVIENYAFLLRKMNRDKEAAELEARAKAIRAKHQEKNPKN